MDARALATWVTPFAAVATLALGLRVGASDRLVAATVLAAPPSEFAERLPLQLAIVAEYRGIREAAQLGEVVVTARHGETKAEWRGPTNADGIAEADLALAGLRPGDLVEVDVRERGAVLAHGAFALPPAWHHPAMAGFARPTRRDGAIAIDLAPLGTRLPVGFPGSVWVRTSDRATGEPLGDVELDAEAEPGLDIPTPHVKTCASGWAELVVTPAFHVTSLSFHAKKDGKDGLWYGAMPVAGGASHAAIPLRLAPHETRTVDVLAAGTRGTIYAELDDASGRVAAALLEAPIGAFAVPPLEPGLYWLVTSSEPRGAETLADAAVARPFVVGPPPSRACDLGARLAQHASPGFPRTVVLDGMDARRSREVGRHRTGVAIGMAGLLVAAVLEALLVVGSARRGGAELPAAMRRRNPAGSVAIALLSALLGFALLAAILLYRAT